MEKIVFETNVHQEIALKYDEGKPVTGKFNEQYFYTTVDDRCFYLPVPVGEIIHQQLAAQHIKARDRADWVRAEIREKGKVHVRWQIKRIDPLGPQSDGTFAVPTVEQPTVLERQLRESVERAALPRTGEGANGGHPSAPLAPVTSVQQQPVDSPNGNGTTPRAKTQLEHALRTIAVALLEGERFAKSIGYEAWPKQFSSEDIRTFANTLLINASRENGGGR